MSKILSVEEDGAWKDDNIMVDDVSIKYIQGADCVSHEDQEIELFTQNNGTARFIVLKTKRWSISDIGDLEVLIKDFRTRAGIIDLVAKGEE